MTSGTSVFLNNIGRIPLLTPAEEITLGKAVQSWIEVRDQDPASVPSYNRIKRRGERAMQRMHTANLRLVVVVAKKFARISESLEIDDLINEGAIGLMRAVERFDPERGYKFSTYAYWWIRQAMNRSIQMQDRVVRLPCNAITGLSKLRTFIIHYKEEHGIIPSVAECAEHIGASQRSVEHYLYHLPRVGSLDSNGNSNCDDDHSALGELVAADEVDPLEQLNAAMTNDSLQVAMRHLTDFQQEIVTRLYGLGCPSQTMVELAKERGVTRNSISETHQRALKKL